MCTFRGGGQGDKMVLLPDTRMTTTSHAFSGRIYNWTLSGFRDGAASPWD